MTRTALVTGVAGQDGILLARHLLARGYRVVGTVLPEAPTAMRQYLDGVEVEDHDLRDAAGFDRLLSRFDPEEVYNLAGFTSAGASWDHQDLVYATNAVAVEKMLDSLLRFQESGHDVRFFQASSSEVFGPDAANPQDELTAHDPQSPYAKSKSRAHSSTVRAREEGGLFACVGILYNHESPLRGLQFVTRKITRAAAEIAQGRLDSVTLGNLDVSRDWGAARDYVLAMHSVITHNVPGDYAIATGVLHTLKDMVEIAFHAAGVDEPWSHVELDPALLRPHDPLGLAGDASKARRELGWVPATLFEDLVAQMVQADMERLRSGVEESAAYIRF